ncbi:DUF1289 domain-containing protein [Limnohabitans sp.]|uniref:DUF1289 domain-containing protein n=1 Tax=Limnohabitans sp. TaxID=1907725 RepID=UPI002AFF0439|nr:DUF1289 domain-containing protein [Limnohabitans sp.]
MNDYYWDKLAERAEAYLARPSPPEPNSVPSPCMSLCLMHPSAAWCEGCLRTLPEIGGWSRATVQEQHEVWVQIPERLKNRRELEKSKR